MKLYIFNKKLVYFFFLLIFLLFCLYVFLQPHISFAVNLTTNSILNKNIEEKFRNLTTQNDKIAYLTFDDGPTLKATPKVLDILKEEDVKATFFVIGKYVKKHPELVKRAYEEGHYIANHGYDHSNKKLYANHESFIEEIKNTDIEISKAIDVENYSSHVFRFPNGFMSKIYTSQKKEAAQLLKEINYTYIDWNCLNNDSIKKYSQTQLLNNLKNSAKNKGTLVILMHDTSDVNDTPSVLKASIDYLKEQGYVFQNFYSLINTPNNELK